MLNLQPQLQNNQLLLRPLLLCDFEPLYEVAKDPLIWKQHPIHNRWQRSIYATFFQEALHSKGTLVIMDRSNNKIIGSSRFKPIKNSNDAIEIGWSFLAKNYWGGYYNGITKSLMINHAFQQLDFVVFFIGKENIRSQRAVEKLGAILASQTVYSRFIRNPAAEKTYVITKSGWQTH